MGEHKSLSCLYTLTDETMLLLGQAASGDGRGKVVPATRRR